MADASLAPATKICIKCHQEKSIDSFHKRSGRKDGRHNECQDCRKIIYRNRVKDVIRGKKQCNEEGTKICRKCGHEKLLADFFKDKMFPDGHKSRCKECIKAYQIEFNNRPKIEVQSKLCWNCKETKDVQNFNKNKSSPDGFDYYCQSCKKKKYHKYVRSEKEVTEEKYCPECETTKSSDLFFKSNNHKYGLSRLCKDCTGEKNRCYREENIEKIRKMSRDYHHNNRDECIRKMRDRYNGNIDFYREMGRKYYRENIEKIRSYQKSYFHIRRAREIGAEGSFTKQDIDNIFFNQRGKCAHCKKKLGKNYHRDHIVPLVKGGSNWPDNIQLLCPTCNLSKGGKDPFDWAKLNGKLL